MPQSSGGAATRRDPGAPQGKTAAAHPQIPWMPTHAIAGKLRKLYAASARGQMTQNNPKQDERKTPDEEVLSSVDKMIDYYSSRSTKYGWRLWMFKVFGLLSSIAVTVLSGIPLIQTGCPWLITVVAGLATLFAGLLSATKAQEYYVNAGSQQAKVASERLLFHAGGGPYRLAKSPEDKLRLLTERVAAINLAGMKDWENINKGEQKSLEAGAASGKGNAD